MKTITLVRHAKINGEPALYGATDIGISEHEVINTLDCLSKLHQQNPITKIITSPLQRCCLPAKKFSDNTGLPFEINPLAQEMYFALEFQQP